MVPGGQPEVSAEAAVWRDGFTEREKVLVGKDGRKAEMVEVPAGTGRLKDVEVQKQG